MFGTVEPSLVPACLQFANKVFSLFVGCYWSVNSKTCPVTNLLAATPQVGIEFLLRFKYLLLWALTRLDRRSFFIEVILVFVFLVVPEWKGIKLSRMKVYFFTATFCSIGLSLIISLLYFCPRHCINIVCCFCIFVI